MEGDVGLSSSPPSSRSPTAGRMNTAGGDDIFVHVKDVTEHVFVSCSAAAPRTMSGVESSKTTLGTSIDGDTRSEAMAEAVSETTSSLSGLALVEQALEMSTEVGVEATSIGWRLRE